VDDGAEVEARLAIEGRLADGMLLPRIEVPNTQFSTLDWPMKHWGTRTIIGAGLGAKDRIREAIQRCSPNIVRRHVYAHTGWRQIAGEGWVYLHADGGIGADGPVAGLDVALGEAATKVAFPDPPTGTELHEAVRASLALFELGPRTVMASVLGATYRAPLASLLPADVSGWLMGRTGTFKSELSTLAMQHYGAAFDRLHLPAQWTSTENALERTLFDFKDALCVIDDFAPGGTVHDIARMHKVAERVLRSIGNHGGRSRMNANGTLRKNYPPRGMLLSTGEDAPKGHSAGARLMLEEIALGDIDETELAAAQMLGRKGVLVAGMAGFLQWVAPRYDELRSWLPDLFTELRAQATGGLVHARTPEAVAHLAIGWKIYLRYAADVGAITEREMVDLFTRVWAALGEAAANQRQHQESQEPTLQFIEALSSALSSGAGHVAAMDGTQPKENPGAWGWRQQFGAWAPGGDRVGWVDGDNLYINIEVAVNIVRPLTTIPLSAKTLAKRLHEQKYLKSSEGGHEGHRVRRTIEDRRMRVLHFSTAVVGVEKSGQSGQSGHEAQEPTQLRQNTGEVDPIFRSRNPATA
jgi:hypothetical protein